MTRRTILVLLGMVTVLAFGESAEAQRRRTPTYASRPTISPYINMFNPSVGGINNYIGYVRPQMQWDQFMQDTTRRENQMMRASQQQAQEIERTIVGAIEDEERTILQLRPTSSGTVRRVPGTFMNTQRYYPAAGGVGRR